MNDMINRKFTYAIIALLTLGITGCSQDDDLTPPVDGKQELRIATRSTDGAGNTTETFTRPFVLELWYGNRKETFQMTYTEGSGWNTVKSSYPLPVTAFAYCGKGVADVTSPYDYNVDLELDQTDSDKLMAADVMIATGKAQAGVPLDLVFEHYFSKMTFNVTYEGFTNAPTLTEIKSNGISCFLNGDKIEMIMRPGDYIAGMEILSLKVNGVTQSVRLKENTEIVKGTHYTYNLKIGTKEATLTATNVGYPGGWGDSDSETELN